MNLVHIIRKTGDEWFSTTAVNRNRRLWIWKRKIPTAVAVFWRNQTNSNQILTHSGYRSLKLSCVYFSKLHSRTRSAIEIETDDESSSEDSFSKVAQINQNNSSSESDSPDYETATSQKDEVDQPPAPVITVSQPKEPVASPSEDKKPSSNFFIYWFYIIYVDLKHFVFPDDDSAGTLQARLHNLLVFLCSVNLHIITET